MKFEGLGEMEKFVEKCSLPTLNEEEGKSLNRLVTVDEIEAVIKKKKPRTQKPWTG